MMQVSLKTPAAKEQRMARLIKKETARAMAASIEKYRRMPKRDRDDLQTKNKYRESLIDEDTLWDRFFEFGPMLSVERCCEA